MSDVMPAWCFASANPASCIYNPASFFSVLFAPFLLGHRDTKHHCHDRRSHGTVAETTRPRCGAEPVHQVPVPGLFGAKEPFHLIAFKDWAGAVPTPSPPPPPPLRPSLSERGPNLGNLTWFEDVFRSRAAISIYPSFGVGAEPPSTPLTSARLVRPGGAIETRGDLGRSTASDGEEG